jgi:hypothetical protein
MAAPARGAIIAAGANTMHGDSTISATSSDRSRAGAATMTSGSMDMTTPVTRGELRAELDQLEQRIGQRFEPRFEQLVTRAELDEKLAQKFDELEQKLDEKLDEKLEQKLAQKLAPLVTRAELDEKLAPLATKVELEFWGGVLLARIESLEIQQKLMYEDLANRIEFTHKQLRSDSEADLTQRIASLHQQLSEELARHVKVLDETVARQASALDDKYNGLPRRVDRLEVAVFRKKPRMGN